MNTILAEEEVLFRDSVLKVLAASHPIGRPMGKREPQQQADAAAWRSAAELGWLGLAVPEVLDGSGRATSDLAIVAEAFGRHLVISPFIASVGFMTAACRSATGIAGEALKGLAAGTSLTVPLVNGEIGADWPAALQASEIAAGRRVVRGRFRAVPHAALGTNLLVPVAAGPGDRMSLHLLPTDAAGVRVTTYALMDGSAAADVELDGVELKAASEVGGGTDVQAGLDTAAALTAAELVGGMWTLQQLTLGYLKTRRQFGVVLSSLQVLQHRLVDMYILCQTAESAMLDAISAIDSEDAGRRALRVSQGCAHVFQAARKVAEEAIQLHGGIAMTAEYAVGSYMKRMTVLRTQFGDEAWHRERVRRLTRQGVRA